MKRFPWWGSVILAIITYYGLKYGLATYLGDTAPLVRFARLLAPILTVGFLLLAAKQLYDDDAEEPPPSDEDDAPTDIPEE